MKKELVFCGENRKAHLQNLKSIFRIIDRSANSIEEESAPSHRVVLIEGERGLGKTRLVMELFRYMCQYHDPDKYWPDHYLQQLGNVEVMPRAQECQFTNRPYFMWIGLSISDAPNPGNTIFSSLNEILPHLMAIRIATKSAKSKRGFALEVADTAIDLGIEAGPEFFNIAADVSGLGVLKRLAEATTMIGRIISRSRGQNADVKEEANKELDLVSDSLLSDLSLLFSKRSKTFARIPLVVFIDDAQFADRDPGMASFVKSLLERAAKEHWPLLLIFTHWSRQLNYWKDAEGKSHNPSIVAQTLEQALFEQSGQKVVTNGHYNTLHADFLTKIDLNEPVEALDAALSECFPNLQTADINEIIDKSGGNPRKLEQIIERMARKPKWFESSDTNKPLTETGKEAILSMADLPIEEVVLQRFRDTPEEVRRAMALASNFGPKFVVELAEKISKTYSPEDIREYLEDGEINYRFLREVVDRSQNDIAAFSERLFFDTAREYCDSGLAQSELRAWPDSSSLSSSINGMLISLVTEIEKFDDLHQDEIIEGLYLAATRLEDCSEALAIRALAALHGLEKRRGNTEAAYSIAIRLKDRMFCGELLTFSLTIKEVIEILESLELLGETELLIRTYKALHDHFQLLLSESPKDSFIEKMLYTTKVSLARLNRACGEIGLAFIENSRALQICKQNILIDRSSIYWRFEYAQRMSEIGQLREESGEFYKAFLHFNGARSTLQKLYEFDSNDVNVAHALAISYLDTARMHKGRGSKSSADSSLLESANVLKGCISNNKDSALLRFTLAQVYILIGDDYFEGGDIWVAEEYFNLSIGIVKQLRKIDPIRSDWLRLLSSCHAKLGGVNKMRENFNEALADYQHCFDICNEMITRDPVNLENRECLADAYENIGIIFRDIGDRSRAGENFAASLKLRESLFESVRSNARFQRSLIRSLVLISEDSETTWSVCERALLLARDLEEKGKLSRIDYDYIPRLERKLSELKASDKDFREALNQIF